MWHTYYAPSTLAEALALRSRYRDASRILAGGTDLILEIERGGRQAEVLIDISRVSGLDRIVAEKGELRLGPMVTHNQVVGAPEAVAGAFPLANACWQVGAPQIRNRGTVAGNLVTASPANDTISPLWAMDATVTLASAARGQRTLRLDEFFLGVRRTALHDDEILVSVNVPLLSSTERGTFLKFGLRQAQAISVANVAVVVDWGSNVAGDDGQASPGYGGRAIRRARVALGAVAPTILRAADAEAYLGGRPLTDDVIARAAELAAQAARPISDVRASAPYRRALVRTLTARALFQLRDGTERSGWPARPVMLWGGTAGHAAERAHAAEYGEHTEQPISMTINGEPVVLPNAHGKTLLRVLREDAGLSGTKEGCSEGECGACTVWLDGIAVMACLVPVERADGCEIVTVEGLAGPDGRLHPVQDAFVQEGAVQCGYCTPGLLMSAASLLEEVSHPTSDQVKEALSGNLCRCTGYFSILKAVDRAAGWSED